LTGNETSTESPLNVKKFEKVGEFKNKIEDTLKPYYLAYIFLISAKNQSKKISCKCTFREKNAPKNIKIKKRYQGKN
jgi:hypothetical protein